MVKEALGTIHFSMFPELGKTAAELSGEEKNKVSHRGQAVAKLKEQWEEWLKIGVETYENLGSKR